MIGIAENCAPPQLGRRTDKSSFAVFSKICSFPVMLATALALLDFLSVRDRFNDSDTWWHLRVGQIVWTTRVIPTSDTFSYTTGHHAWVPHEWLAQLSLFAFYHVAAYRGILLWLLIFSAAILVGGYVLCAIYSGNVKTAFVGALVLWLFSTAGLSPRPQLMGYLLLIIELLLLELGRTRSARWFWGLPPLFALWVNTHGSFSFGIGILVVVLGCSFLSIHWGLIVSAAWDGGRRAVLAWCTALSFGALVVNPDGLRQVFYPLDLMFNQPFSLAYVHEWQPLTIATGRGLALILTLAFIGLLLLTQRVTVRLEELLLLSLASWSALEHERMVFVFGVIVAPIVARLLASLWEGYDPETDIPWANAVIILCTLFSVVHWFPSETRLDQIVKERNPSQAVQYIRENHLTGPMLNAYNFGGYLIWALPEQPVFIDGRADVYDWTGVMAQVARWATLQDDPNVLLDRYHVHFCLLEKGSSSARLMSLLPSWKQVYADQLSVIFVRRS